MIKCFMTQSNWYKGALRQGKPVGILWHDTAAGNPNLCRYVQPDDNAPDKDELLAILGKNKYGNDWNHIDRDAGLNAWIGKRADGVVDVVQVGEWDIHAWGCGAGDKGSCNGYTKTNGKTTWVDPFWIQFEICDDGYNDEAYFNEAYKKAVEFTAFICKTFDIDPFGKVMFNGIEVPTILCHADSYKLGLGSNHGDVYKWFNKFGKTMEDVRKDVKEELSEVTEWTKFTVRTTKPTGGKLYNNKNHGGINWCIDGKPMDSECSVLSNCVGYANGRFEEIYREITGYDGKDMKFWYLCNNAENWIERAEKYGLEMGQEPRPGAVICWQKGPTTGSSDGAGHVAIVEEVYEDGSILTSESGYGNSNIFWTKKRTKGSDGRWGQSADYTLRAFIYNPAVKRVDPPTPPTPPEPKPTIVCPCCGARFVKE